MKSLVTTVMINVVILVLVNINFSFSGSVRMYQKSINWGKYPDQQTYTTAMARADFGPVTGWVDSRAMTSNGTLRVTILKNALSGDGGLIANTQLPDGTAYELDFDVRFHSQFDWSRGGKVGFGFGVGNDNTGCNLPLDGAGGSLRIMWYNNPSNKRVYFTPYLYYYGMPGPCGDTFDKSYPSSGSIQKDQWYRVHMDIKSNTGSNYDGHAQIKINDQVVIDQDMRWTTNDSKRFINNLSFHTFRGGKGDQWKSPNDTYIYYDNLSVRQIS